MLLVAKRRRMAFQIALLPLTVSVVLVAAALRGIAFAPVSGAVVASLVAVALLVYAVATATFVRGRAHTVIVRSVTTSTTFDARAAAFGVAAAARARVGPRYTVYVTDGMKRSNVATYASRRALAAATRLTEAFAVANRGGSAEARGLVSREIAAWKAKEDEARRNRAFYASPAVVGVLLVAGLAALAYVLVTAR